MSQRRRRHPHLLHYYLADPLTYKGGVPAGFAVPLVWEMEAATRRSELLLLQQQDAAAALLVHAVHDPLCDITGSVNCFSNLLGVPDRQLIAIDGPASADPVDAPAAAAVAAPAAAASSDGHGDTGTQQEGDSSSNLQDQLHPKLHALYPGFDFHIPAADAAAASQQQLQQQKQQEWAEDYQRRKRETEKGKGGKPKVLVARGIDVVHDLPNEPGQHLLFPLLASWITSRCPPLQQQGHLQQQQQEEEQLRQRQDQPD